MSDFGTRLKAAISDAKTTQKELAEKIGITQQSVQYLCSGKARSSKNITQIAKILNVTPEWLETGTLSINEPITIYKDEYRLPLFSIKELDRDLPASKKVKCPFDCSLETFALLIEGDPTAANAMHPSYGRAYPVGSIVFADPTQANECKNGDIVIAELTDRPNKVTTFRQLYQEGGSELLLPLNPQFPPVLEPFKITAKVIGAILP